MNEIEYKFNFEDNKQNLLQQSLISQAINMYGADLYYIPLKQYTPDELDDIFQEVPNKNYEKVYKMRMLLEDQSMMQGQKSLFTKFGLEIVDEIILWVTRLEFYERITGNKINVNDYILDNENNNNYDEMQKFADTYGPNISDLIYIPIWESFFTVDYIERQEDMLAGKKAFFKLICKKYIQDSNDNINIKETGIGESLDNEVEIDKELINDINNMSNSIKERKTDINMNVNDTGFEEPSITIINNDNIEDEAESNKDKKQDSDFFGEW